MSLINKFTIGFQKDKGKRRSIEQSHNSTLKIKSNSEETNKQVLSQELVETLITFGFDLKQLMIAHKEYKFSSIDEACFYLMKDNESGKYNHRFIKEDKNEGSNYTNLNTNICGICGGDPTEHIDFDYEEKQLISGNNKNSITPQIPFNNNNNQNFNKSYSNRNKDINLDIYNSNTNLKEKIEDFDSKILNNEEKFQNNNMNFGNNQTVGNSENYDNKSPEDKSNQDVKLTSVNNNEIGTEIQNNLMNSKKPESKLPNVHIDIPPETLDLFDDPDICRICFGEKITQNNKAEFACGHMFCRKCVTNYLTNSIMNGKVLMIKCLYGGCPKTFVEEEIKMYIGDQLFYKYKKFKIAQIKLNNPDKNYMNCPIPDCEEIVEIESNENEDPFVMCNYEHKFCSKCKSPGWHKKGKCNEYVSQLLRQIQKDNKESENYKQCPRCSVIIEKNEGCNQMKCLNCSLEFCWLCLKRYTQDHYAIYNFRGCPGMRFNSSNKRKIWNNPFLKTLWLMSSCILGILAVLLLIVFFAFFGCAYEFAKCYIEKSYRNDDEEEDSNYEYNLEQENQIEPTKQLSTWDKVIIGILIVLGILCQPIYLMIYLLYALMECYRRFNCWFYYID